MPKHKLAVLASGNGTNFERLAQACQKSEIPESQIVCLIADRACGATSRARRLGIASFVLEPKKFPDMESWSKALLDSLKKQDAGLILLAGFLRKIPPALIKAYPAKILNIHPALLPKYGGQGMYGRRVHEAVLASKEIETGVTIHVVDEEYDHGPVIWQEKIPVLPTDTPETLQFRIHEIEHRAYPKAVAFYLKHISQKRAPLR